MLESHYNGTHQTIVLPKEFGFENANGWKGSEEFKREIAKGPFMEDYKGFWIVKLFYDQSELPSVNVDPNCPIPAVNTTTVGKLIYH